MQLQNVLTLAGLIIIGALVGVGLDRTFVRSQSVQQDRALQFDPGIHDNFEPAPDSATSTRSGGFNLTQLSVERSELRSGGPGKDGIPALTDPKVTPLTDASFLSPQDRLIAVTLDGTTRLYPIRILTWHEVINDTLAAHPIAVIYCPLCDSVSVIKRQIHDETLEFGVSGLLYNSNVLLHDRTHHALWSQIKMEAISGPYVGYQLEHLPFDLLTLEKAQTRYPQSTILTLETGHARNYAENPYRDYFQHDRTMFPVTIPERLENQMNAKTRIIGISGPDMSLAVPVRSIVLADGRLELTTPTRQRITLKADDVNNAEVTDLPAGYQAMHTFWFAWAATHPNTKIWSAADAD